MSVPVFLDDGSGRIGSPRCLLSATRERERSGFADGSAKPASHTRRHSWIRMARDRNRTEFHRRVGGGSIRVDCRRSSVALNIRAVPNCYFGKPIRPRSAIAELSRIALPDTPDLASAGAESPDLPVLPVPCRVSQAGRRDGPARRGDGGQALDDAARHLHIAVTGRPSPGGVLLRRAPLIEVPPALPSPGLR